MPEQVDIHIAAGPPEEADGAAMGVVGPEPGTVSTDDREDSSPPFDATRFLAVPWSPETARPYVPGPGVTWEQCWRSDG